MVRNQGYDQTGNRVDNAYGITFEELYDYASTSRTSDQIKMGKEEQIFQKYYLLPTVA
jgi:hypothetical protein